MQFSGLRNMLNELSKNINKQVVITLTNGKERQGIIVGLDAESNTIRLRDEINNSISILISMIGMFEPVNNASELVKPPIRQPDNLPDNANGQKINNYEILQKIVKIETTFDTEIKNAVLKIFKPNFATPSDISNLNAHRLKIDTTAIWNWIKDKYDYAIKTGRLIPNSDELRAIIDRTKSLIETSELSKSYVLNNSLGYFNYLNNNKSEAIKAYMNAAKLSNKPENWLNLASIASEKGENEMACYALEKLFFQSACTENQYEKAWYKFTDLIIKFSAYNIFDSIFNSSRLLLKEEQYKIFETICYCLIKKGHQKIVETQLQNSVSNPDYKKLVSENLLVLPQHPLESYVAFTMDFERLISKPIIIDTLKPKQSASILEPKRSFIKDIDLHREALKILRNQKDYTKAEELFRLAIKKGSNKQSAVRDLAMMLDQLKRTDEAIELVKQYTDNSEPDKNLLYILNYKAGNYEKAISLQKELVKSYENYLHTERINENITSVRNKKVTMYINLASCYLKLEKYKEVEDYYKIALKFNPDNYTLKRNIAICHYKQGHIDLAKTELQRIVSEFPDGKVIELLNAINSQLQNPNKNNRSIDIIIANTLAQYSIDLDKFTYFYLNRFEYKGVPPEAIKEGRYIANENDREKDIDKIEKAATALGTKNPEDRSGLYLSAAKIMYDSESKDKYFYRYLCKSFTSKGDSAVYDKRSLDTIKTFYLAALKVYDVYTDDDKEKKLRVDEQDAVNALYRYLYAHLGMTELQNKVIAIRVGTFENQLKQIKDSCEDVFEKIFITYKNYNNIFEAINLAIARSPQYASKRLLTVIFDNFILQHAAIDYLHKKLKKTVQENNLTFEKFVKLWNELSSAVIQQENNLFEQLNLLNRFELSEVWLKNAIEKIKNLLEEVIFNSDKGYLSKLQSIFDSCISLCNSTTFDEKIIRRENVEQGGKSFLNEIEKNPTKLSIEEIYPIIKNVLSTIESYLNNLYQTSRPELVISSAIVSYQLKENNQIDLQVKIENTAEGHAEQVELLIDNDNDFYELVNMQTVAYGTIRGKEKETQIIALKLNPKAIAAKAFTLRANVKFRTRQGESVETSLQELPIQLGDAKDFVEIKPNPYAQWVRGGTVVDKTMFFGREEFIKRAYSAICNNYRSYVIYGQFRSGKSSILHHLEQELKTNSQIMVAEIGDVGRLMDDNSPTPLLYQMLFGILRRIHKSIQDKERNGLSKLDFYIPTSQEFYGHPAPLDFFYELFDNLKEKRNNYPEWTDIRIVVTMDEFTYLYEKIIQGKLSHDFMKNWKALLATNYFNVVLVAQDVFPKFRNKYDNAFQTMQHERVTYLEEPDAKELIDKPIRIKINQEDTESRYTEQEAIDRICELTACSPYYIQIFCNQLVDYINDEKQPYITKANVSIVKDRLLRGNKRLDKTAFTNLINNSDPSADAIPHSDLIKVLKKIAEHTKNDPYCSSNKINCETQIDINEILKDLEDRDVIDKHGEKGFRIRVGLFKEWLNENPGFLE